MSEVLVNRIDYNKIYHSNNYGDFIFLKEIEPYEYISSNGILQKERRAEIKFLQTNTITNVHVRDALRGAIKDPYYPKIHGVACVGNTYTNGDHRFLYYKWKSMIDRVYGKLTNKSRFYTNCSVDPRWLCFEEFLKYAPYLPGYQDMINNPGVQYSLDKDILQQGVEFKVYSPETCMWIPTKDNILQAIVDNKYKKSSQYYGIVVDRGAYKVQPTVRTPYGPVGMYNNEIAAVNVREWYRPVYYPNIIANVDYPKMPLDEAIKYRRHKKKPIKMYSLIDNK